jgi:type I restriction enzyme, S subunit
MTKFNPYPAYKESGVEGVEEIPAHWEVRKTTWLFKIGSGTTPSDDPIYYGGDIPWITTSELRETVIDSTEKTLTEEALQDFPSLKMHPEGSVAVAMYGATIGRLGILGIAATVNQACCVFSDPKDIDARFWFYWLQMRRDHLISLGYGGGQPNLSQGLLRSIRVPTPPSTEQEKIVAFLDRETAKIDAMLAKKDRVIGLLQEKRTALITRAITEGLDPNVPMKDSGVDWLGEIPAHWDVDPLKRNVEMREGPGIMAADFTDEGVPLLRIAGIGGRTATLDGCNYLSPDLVQKRWAHFRVIKGDLRSGSPGPKIPRTISPISCEKSSRTDCLG